MKILSSEVNEPKPESQNNALLQAIAESLLEEKTTKWISGIGTPTDSNGRNGDFYLDEASFDFYKNTKEGWQHKGSLKGRDGINGLDGDDGDDGLSAYEVWAKNGNHGTVRTFLNSLIGERGPTGPQGPKGDKGEKGDKGDLGQDGREVELRKNATHLQWHYVGEDKWINLIPLSDLKGPAGMSQIIGGNGGGLVQSVRAGTNVTVDSSDAANPIINASGGGGANTLPTQLITTETDYTVTQDDNATILYFQLSGDFEIIIPNGLTAGTYFWVANGGGGTLSINSGGISGSITTGHIVLVSAIDGMTDTYASLDVTLDAGGAATWGQISGTLSNQTDLQTALDLKKTDSMTTNKLLGRSTAGTGVIEEMTLGTNLSFDGATLNATSSDGRLFAESQPWAGDVLGGAGPTLPSYGFIGDEDTGWGQVTGITGTGGMTLLSNGNYVGAIGYDAGIFYLNARAVPGMNRMQFQSGAAMVFIAATGHIEFETMDATAGVEFLGYRAGTADGRSIIFRTEPTSQAVPLVIDLPETPTVDAQQWMVNGTVVARISSAGYLGLGIIPTAVLHLKAGTSTANTAPIKFTAGTNLTTPEAGVVEFDGTSFFLTDGSTRRTVITNTATQTLTNKRITKRSGTTTSSATPTINTDNVDYYSITALAVDITSFTTNLSGTPTIGQTLWLAITGTASRAITWGASFESSTATLPTTTSGTNRLDVGFIWNEVASKWRCIATT